MNPAVLLLADRSPCLRYLTLTRLLDRRKNDSEVLELETLRREDPMVRDILAVEKPERCLPPGITDSYSSVFRAAFILGRLGYLGFDRSEPAVEKLAEYILSRRRKDGTWSIGDTRKMDTGEDSLRGSFRLVSLQVSLPLKALALAGYAEDPRCEGAYDWLLKHRLPDGAWPSAEIGEVYGSVAGYRRLAHSRWGCRTNTIAALVCLALHPARRNSQEARRALDLLLTRETREQMTLGNEVARILGARTTRGFLTFHARYDLGLVLFLCSRIGATRDDARVDGFISYLESLRGNRGLWYCEETPQVSRWVSYDVLMSLKEIKREGDWVSLEPSTPFQPYPRIKRRF